MGELSSATIKNRWALTITLILTLVYLVVEVIGGILTNSLALFADAAHMLTDVGGLALALFATWMSQKSSTPSKTYGYYRVEILAALTNAVVLFLGAFYILYEAYHRFLEPPPVVSGPMLVVATIGLGVNLVGVWILHQGAAESLNVQVAFLEVVSDTLGSLGVITAGLIMLVTGWYYADPIASILISLFIFPRTWKLMVQAVNILLEGAPAHIDVDAVAEAIKTVAGMTSVHDLHVWTITSGIEMLSAHVVLADNINIQQGQEILEEIGAGLKEKFRIEHSTIQLEYRDLQPQEMRL